MKPDLRASTLYVGFCFLSGSRICRHPIWNLQHSMRENPSEELVNSAILKEVKSVKEQIDTCPADRTELLEEYRARLAVFEEFAPKMLSAEEVEAILTEKFADVLATKNKGNIMKHVMPELKGKADGKVINQVVAKLCQ